MSENAHIRFTIRDHSDEYSTVSFPIGTVSEINWIAIETAADLLQTALAAATTGKIAKRSMLAYSRHIDDTRPVNPYAQREIGLRLFYLDTVNGKKYHLTIPAPDLVVMGQGGTDEIDLTGSLADPIVAAMQGLMQSVDGNPVQVYRGLIVGRRN
jgi:hypothetical protein